MPHLLSVPFPFLLVGPSTLDFVVPSELAGLTLTEVSGPAVAIGGFHFETGEPISLSLPVTLGAGQRVTLTRASEAAGTSVVRATLDLDASPPPLVVRAVSSSNSALNANEDYVRAEIEADTTVYLCAANLRSGDVTIKRVDATAAVLTIAPSNTSADSVDGEASLTLGAKGSVTLRPRADGWDAI